MENNKTTVININNQPSKSQEDKSAIFLLPTVLILQNVFSLVGSYVDNWFFNWVEYSIDYYDLIYINYCFSNLRNFLFHIFSIIISEIKNIV